MSAKRTKAKPTKKEKKGLGLKPIPFETALRAGMLRLACLLLTGFEIRVHRADAEYVVLGDDAFSVVALHDDVARCITCRKPCLCADAVKMWRRRLRDLGAAP